MKQIVPSEGGCLSSQDSKDDYAQQAQFWHARTLDPTLKARFDPEASIESNAPELRACSRIGSGYPILWHAKKLAGETASSSA